MKKRPSSAVVAFVRLCCACGVSLKFYGHAMGILTGQVSSSFLPSPEQDSHTVH
ncbi:hypothetical protein OH77DRAFT_1419110 [Trametes cingulata]|nr:hypothetical protein OH77DRAFT_1419110 [Trametes cingulata]